MITIIKPRNNPMSFLLFILYTEGEQNMPPQNMPLWHKDCFEVKAIKRQQT